jgi:protein farnesyltransferase subunit beta
MQLEGGFQGRTNKLVDGCYSFWQGAGLFCLLQSLQPSPSRPGTPTSAMVTSSGARAAVYDRLALQRYILVCCQDDEMGGFSDRPDSQADYYHTCYCLSGLALAQTPVRAVPGKALVYSHRQEHELVLGGPGNVLVCL